MLEKNSGLHIKKMRSVLSAAERGPLSLFFLCFGSSFIPFMLTATNRRLKIEGKKECSLAEIKACIGIEILCSILNIRVLRDCWSQNPFVGNRGIQDSMGRDRYILIRSHITFNVENVNPLDKLNDPLWSIRTLLRNFLKISTSLAVPTGCMTLDEATMPSRARNTAVSYIPSKPQKYGVRFYLIVGSKYQYIFTMYDNGRGHIRYKTLPLCLRYLDSVNMVRSPLARACNLKKV